MAKNIYVFWIVLNDGSSFAVKVEADDIEKAWEEVFDQQVFPLRYKVRRLELLETSEKQGID
ncbi:hypothetical protein [Paenibacillus montanisoli]|uniref:DUF3906 domain-containing protein n=1 Tax=Paenibacillus montanisoli TaxID=2081970 RepID=A0A328U9I3_9BACL|nr:hypothetical protein [Paenibacillus montanisoli]RAP78503.1 hypothetical protein DL346_08810 [Paenibacillus montanisoli]